MDRRRRTRRMLATGMGVAALALTGACGGDDDSDKAATLGADEAEAATVQPSTPSNSTSGTSDAAQAGSVDVSAKDKTRYFVSGGASDAAQP